MSNPLSGHTSATGFGADAQGLRDGDGLTSPSLTNLYEAVHGNGILRLGDGARGDSLRNSIVANTPGYIQTTGTQGEIKVFGGYCVLDGILYKFAGGPGSHETLIVGDTGTPAFSGDLPSVPSSNSDVFVVVYLAGRDSPEAHVRYEMGTPAAPTSGTPLIPNRFLTNPQIGTNTDLNHQTTVLGVIRYSMTGGAGSVTASLGSPVIHDRRAFIRMTPSYLTPMTKGSIGNVDESNKVTDLDSFFPSPEDGALGGSTFGAIWQTHRTETDGSVHGVFLAAMPRDLDGTPTTDVHVLGPERLEVVTTGTNITFTFEEANVWVITTTGNITLNGSGTFPAGHTVDVYHKSGAHTLHFDPTSGGHGATPINVDVGNGESARFVYDGNNWHQVIAAASSFTTSSGASGLVQLSDGSGGFTSDTTLSYNTGSNELTVDGKLTVTGLIDPTGLVIDEKANVAATGHSTVAAKGLIWVKNDSPNRLYFTDDAGTDKKVIHATDSVTELSDVSAVGSGSIITSAERTKLTGIETGATADQTDAEIRAAVEAATDSNVFTDADHTKLNGIATGATAYADSDAIAAVEGEATLDLTGAVTVQTDLKLTTSSDHVVIENVTQDKDITFKVNDGGSPKEVLRMEGATGDIGIGTTDPKAHLHISDGTTSGLSAATDVSIAITDGGVPRIYFEDTGEGSGDKVAAIAYYDEHVKIQSMTDTGGGYDQENILVANRDGNVGVGTVPSQKLHVSGTIRQTAATSTVLVADSNGDIVAATNEVVAQEVGATQSSNLSVGWYTIGYILGISPSGAGSNNPTAQRGFADFVVRDTAGSRHQVIRFQAGHHFGAGNTLTLLNNGSFSASEPVSGIRIKEAGLYSGAALQVYVAQSTNTLTASMHFNEQEAGWVLAPTWLADSDNTGHNLVVGNDGAGTPEDWAFFGSNPSGPYIDLAHNALNSNTAGGLGTHGGLTVSANRGTLTSFEPVFIVEQAGTVVNDSGRSDHDFRVESDTKTHALFVDASANAVSIGTGTVDSNAILTVEGAISLDEISAPSNTADRGQIYTNADNHLHFINGAGTDIKVTEEVFIVALSDESSDLTTGTGKASFHMPFAMTLTGVKASVNTAPTGATITVDINEGGSTILSTKLTIDASEKTSSTAATAAVISDSALADNAELTFDIDQIGSSNAGKGLKVTLYGYRA